MKEKSITVKEAAKHLRMSEEAVHKLVEAGKIPATKEGDLWKLKKKSILDVLNYQIKSLKKEDLAQLEIDPEKKIIAIHTLLKPKFIILNLLGNTKSKVLEELSSTFAKKDQEKKGILLTAIRDREKLCTTAITEGVAVPHPRRAIKNLVKKPVVIFGRSRIGVDFESIDGNLTYLFFLVCAPKEDVHLKIMARLSRLLRNYEFKKSLKDASNKEQIIEIIKQYEQQDKINI